MGDRYLDRIERASKEAEAAELAALLVTPSADLLYLTGYDPPPLERLTCLVVRPETDPVLLVPLRADFDAQPALHLLATRVIESERECERIRWRGLERVGHVDHDFAREILRVGELAGVLRSRPRSAEHRDLGPLGGSGVRLLRIAVTQLDLMSVLLETLRQRLPDWAGAEDRDLHG